MSSKWGILVILLTFGCQGPKGDPGPQGPGGGVGGTGSGGATGGNGSGGSGGSGGGIPPVAVTCNPGAQYCDANRLWSCTRSGADATLYQDCNTAFGGSANNPFTCATTHCPYYTTTGVCCRPTKATCTWSLGGSVSLSGTVYPAGYEQLGTYCAPPTAPPANCASGDFSVQMFQPHAAACPPADDRVSLTIKRGTLTPGTSITLPNAGVSLIEYVSGKSCSSWTGAITWDADVPHWKVTFNATCSETSNTTTLTGTMSGEI
jgi:hypothetical protein